MSKLNDQSVGGFLYVIEHLCMVLKVPLEEVDTFVSK